MSALPVPQSHPVQFDGGSAYGRKALQNACDAVMMAPSGDKHKMLNKAAWEMGRLVAAGALDEPTVKNALGYAGQQTGFNPSEAPVWCAMDWRVA